jgi:hypothetical protein
MFKILTIFVLLWIKSELYPTLIRKFLRLLILFIGMLPGFVVLFILKNGRIGGAEQFLIYNIIQKNVHRSI